MFEEVREDYLDSLEELTVNSRPIIKTLTEIAQENVADSSAVADAVEKHIFRCAPNHQLPALYLLDSICKNIGEPYTGQFSSRILGIFTHSFNAAPEPIRLKLNELFKTWTVPMPNTGEPLFSHDTLRLINDFMVQQRMSQVHPSSDMQSSALQSAGLSQQFPAPQNRNRLTQSALMVEINRFRQLLENDNPDQFNERQLSRLARLQAQISGVVDPKLLPTIQADLEESRLNRDQHLLRSAGNLHSRRGGQNGNQRREHRRNNRDQRDSSSRDAKTRSKSNGGISKITGTNNVPLGTRRLRGSDISSSEAVAVAADAISGGVGGDSGRSVEELEGLDLARACEQKASDSLINQLYAEGLPLQCSTCGYRFLDTEEGRKRKEAEMDWHFRANKDMREGHSRNRCWFLVAVSWISYRDEEELFGSGPMPAITTGSVNGSGGIDGAHNGAEAVDLEKEREKYIEVPLESNVVCPVCQEPHETSWSEEAENWVWMNAVEIDGHYFHATCFADPQNKQLVATLVDRKDLVMA